MIISLVRIFLLKILPVKFYLTIIMYERVIG